MRSSDHASAEPTPPNLTPNLNLAVTDVDRAPSVYEMLRLTAFRTCVVSCREYNQN